MWLVCCIFLLLWFGASVNAAPDGIVHDIKAITCSFDEATFCHYTNYGWGFTLSVKKVAQHIANRVWSVATSSRSPALASSTHEDDSERGLGNRIPRGQILAQSASEHVSNATSHSDYFPCTAHSTTRATMQLRLQPNLTAATSRSARLCLHISYAVRGNGRISVKFGNRTWNLLGDAVTGGWFRGQVPLWQMLLPPVASLETEEDVTSHKMVPFWRLRLVAKPDACVDNISFSFAYPPSSSPVAASQIDEPTSTPEATTATFFTSSPGIVSTPRSPPSTPEYGCRLEYRPLRDAGEADPSGTSLLVTQSFFFGLTALRNVLEPYLWVLPLLLTMFGVLLLILYISISCSRPKRSPVPTLTHSTVKSGTRSLQRQGSIQLPTIVQSRVVATSDQRVQATRSLIITDDYSVHWDTPGGPATLPTRFSSHVEEEELLSRGPDDMHHRNDIWQRSSQLVQGDTEEEDLPQLGEALPPGHPEGSTSPPSMEHIGSLV